MGSSEVSSFARLSKVRERQSLRGQPKYRIGDLYAWTLGLTGKFKFRKTLWGKIVLQLEEEVKPFWSRSQPVVLKRRWRDATLMDLAAPEMRHLIDMRFKPYLYAHGSIAQEGASAPGEPHEAGLGAGRPTGELRRVEH